VAAFYGFFNLRPYRRFWVQAQAQAQVAILGAAIAASVAFSR
jgi:hypothetical protein